MFEVDLDPAIDQEALESDAPGRGIADRLREFRFAGQARQLLLPEIEERRDDSGGPFLAHLHSGCRLATYAMWWIKASIQEYILRSWSLVKMGTTANQKKLFFNLRKAKSKISALDEGDLHPDQVKLIAKRLGVTDQDVIDMNRRLGGDASLNAPIRDDGEAGEWQDWLVDNSPNQEAIMAEHEEFDHRREALNGAIGVLNPRERRIFEARRLAEEPMTLEDLAAEFGVSRERVRQIEVRAFEKVQSAVKGTIARQEAAALEAAH